MQVNFEKGKIDGLEIREEVPIHLENNFHVYTAIDENNFEDFMHQENGQVKIIFTNNNKKIDNENVPWIKKASKRKNGKKLLLNEGNSQKKCGRKRKDIQRSDSYSEHNKFSDDNIRRKCKHLVLKYILKFINDTIKNLYKNNIGNGIFKKQLQTLNHSQKSNATIEFNKKFINKTLQEIFSENITTRITNFPANHNQMLIQKLLNESDESKKIFFNNLFSLTFIQVLKHFTGQIKVDILKGMICFNSIRPKIEQKYSDGNDYISSLDYYLKNYDKIINNKKSRKSKKAFIINN